MQLLDILMWLLSLSKIDVYDRDLVSRNDLIGSTMISLADMISLATSSAGVELYNKGECRGRLFINKCEIDKQEHKH